MRRALFLLPSDRMGGAERIIHMLAREAVRSGDFDRVHVFIQCWHKTGTLEDLAAMDNVQLHYAGARRIYRGLLPTIWHLTRHRYDLIFSSHTHLNAIASGLRSALILRTKRLVTRESTQLFDRDFGRANQALRAFYRLYGGQDLIICQTDRMNHALVTNTNARFRDVVATIPNPIDFERIENDKKAAPPEDVQSLSADSTKIVWCGRFSSVKAPALAVEVLRTLHTSGHTHMHLVMIGDGPERTDIETKIASLGLGHYVTLTGHLDTPIPTMARCDVGLVTSKIEGFPNVILEMLASGISRVVTTDCAGGLHEIAGISVSSDSTPQVLADLLLARTPPTEIHSSLQSRSVNAFYNSVMGR